MTDIDLADPKAWSRALGLAEAPLFGPEHMAADRHRVMLDGGHGTFALSVIEEANFDTAAAASWIWSSDIPHHVAVSSDRVTVTRWDNIREPRAFSRSSVRQRFDTFYRFLVQDRVEQSQSVVSHLIEQFRSVRTAVNQAGAEDALSLGVFLALLAELVRNASQTIPGAAHIDGAFHGQAVEPVAAELFTQLRDRQLAPLLERVQRRQLSSVDLDLCSPLAIRHAGGLIFQEAHFELMRTPSPNLFGYLDAPTVKPITRGGAHFTPPALARSVVEQTLAQFGDIADRGEIVLADPACGSGAFLHEALRALRRAGFNGRLHVVGRDVSGHAIAMARFVLAHAAKDWSPGGGITTSVEAADSLVDDALPEADIIVMNPPFVAVGSLTRTQQDHIDRVLGNLKRGRPDLSMAFVLRAIERLKPGGALGCLFPASLVELQAAAPWRRATQERASLRFLGLFGDHGLFAYALVQIAAAVFKKAAVQEAPEVLTLWTADEKEATGEALWALRSISSKGTAAAEEHKTWRIAWLPTRRLQSASSWRLRTPRADRLLTEVRETVESSVEDLFEVRQGVLTGSNDAFVISSDEWASLPSKEQHHFLPAVMNKSIDCGRLMISSYVFYPYVDGKLSIQTEDQLANQLPRFYQRNLIPKRKELTGRASIARRSTDQWWALSERRAWMDRRGARVISKYFGAIGAFVPDVAAKVAVVQGYAWYPGPRLMKAGALLSKDEFSPNLVAAYAALLNTRVFVKLLAEFAPRVSGGQFNLSRRYVHAVPLPDLAQAVLDGLLASAVIELDALGQDIRVADERWLSRGDQVAAELYGVPLEYWK